MLLGVVYRTYTKGMQSRCRSRCFEAIWLIPSMMIHAGKQSHCRTIVYCGARRRRCSETRVVFTVCNTRRHYQRRVVGTIRYGDKSIKAIRSTSAIWCRKKREKQMLIFHLDLLRNINDHRPLLHMHAMTVSRERSSLCRRSHVEHSQLQLHVFAFGVWKSLA